MTHTLGGRTAVVYGGGGALGSAVARTFAREGARVALVGRTMAPLEAVAKEIVAAGGAAEVAALDALDEHAVDEHVRSLGGVDISINLVKRGDVQGVALVDMSVADLLRAVDTGLAANFITARAAARDMAARGSGGVILHLNSASGDGAMPGMGSTGPADAATESFMRYLAAEVGPLGVRVCGIWTAGVRGTLTKEKIAEVDGARMPDPADVDRMLSGMSALRRTPTTADVAETAAFLASDRAAGITGTMTNVTCGLVLR